jgi:hypothetical protein
MVAISAARAGVPATTGDTARFRRYWDRHARRYDQQMRFWERKLFSDTRAWVCSRPVATRWRWPSAPPGASDLSLRVDLAGGWSRLHRAILLNLDDFDVGRIGSHGLQQPGAVEPVGARYSVTSCDLRILVKQPTESISSHDPSGRNDDS